MNTRERFLAVFRYQETDRVPDMEFGYWKETVEKWIDEGSLSENLRPEAGKGYTDWEHIRNFDQKVKDHFGFERREVIPVEVEMYPKFDRKVLKETEDYRVVRSKWGIIQRESKAHEGMPGWIEFPVKNRDDFRKLANERYNPSDPERYPSNWEELAKDWKERDYPLGIDLGGFYSWLRNLMGFERLSRNIIKNPGWIEEMVDFRTNHILDVASTALERLAEHGVQLDYAWWWEDMCYSKGPLISPSHFKKFMVPKYRRITNLLQDYGVDINIVDSDGKIKELVPLWLEVGINCMTPIEAAHNSPLELRKEFGKELLLLGGIDKKALIDGSEEAINQELAKLPNLFEQGGYIPHIDHKVSPDVDFESYQYYIEKKREVLGRS